MTSNIVYLSHEIRLQHRLDRSNIAQPIQMNTMVKPEQNNQNAAILKKDIDPYFKHIALGSSCIFPLGSYLILILISLIKNGTWKQYISTIQEISLFGMGSLVFAFLIALVLKRIIKLNSYWFETFALVSSLWLSRHDLFIREDNTHIFFSHCITIIAILAGLYVFIFKPYVTNQQEDNKATHYFLSISTALILLLAQQIILLLFFHKTRCIWILCSWALGVIVSVSASRYKWFEYYASLIGTSSILATIPLLWWI